MADSTWSSFFDSTLDDSASETDGDEFVLASNEHDGSDDSESEDSENDDDESGESDDDSDSDADDDESAEADDDSDDDGENDGGDSGDSGDGGHEDCQTGNVPPDILLPDPPALVVGDAALGSVVTQIVAFDANSDSLVFSLAPGTETGSEDSSYFQIDASTGELTLMTSMSVNGSFDGDSIYAVQVDVSDGTETTSVDLSFFYSPGIGAPPAGTAPGDAPLGSIQDLPGLPTLPVVPGVPGPTDLGGDFLDWDLFG